MQNKIGGFSVVGGMHRRHWNGIVADIWNVNCAAQAGGYYVARDPRLFILLEQRGAGTTHVRPTPRAKSQLQDYDSGRISYIPAGMELWVDISGVEFVRHLDIHFNAEIVSQRLMENIDPAQLDRPQLHFNDQRVMALAELTGLSQSHFSHAFKASTGLPPHQWQTQARLERAKHLLLNSEMPLTTVAVETGFADQAHFTRVFRKNVGAAPASWKRSRLA